MKAVGRKRGKKPDVWPTEVRVRKSKRTKALEKLIDLVRRYEEVLGAD